MGDPFRSDITPRRYHDRLFRPYALEDGEFLDPIKAKFFVSDKFVFRKVVDSLFMGSHRVDIMVKYRTTQKTEESCINLLVSSAATIYNLPEGNARQFVLSRIALLMRPSKDHPERINAPTARDLERDGRKRALKRMRRWRKDYSHRKR